MRFFSGCLLILLTGCTPYPYACEMPNFALPKSAAVEEYFPTRAHYEARCPSAIPRQFTLSGKTHDTKLSVKIDGEWLRLAAVSSAGSVRLRAPKLRGSDARIDELTNRALSVDAVGPSGNVIDSFYLVFEPLGCTCVSYDGV